MWFLSGFNLFYFSAFCISIIFATLKFERRRIKMKERQRGFFKPWSIPQIHPRAIVDVFRFNDLGPDLSTEISFLPNIQVKGGISDLETWILCVFAKAKKNIFEFGTCSGKTTYLLARNSNDATKITTLTLSPGSCGNYQNDRKDEKSAHEDALKESVYARFYYSDTPEEKKIVQLYGDSKSFDETQHLSSFDLIFIDGSHAYSYVMSDSEKAFKMIRPGGCVIWHDYRGPKRNRDVFRALNQLSKIVSLQHIKGTSLVLFQNK